MKRAILLFGISFASALAFFFFEKEESRTSVYVPSEFAQEERATLEIEGIPYDVSFQQQSTVYDLMKIAEQQHGIVFAGREYAGLGFFVDSINGKRESQIKGMHWIYSINGKKANVGVSWYIIQPNDVISWTYENSDQ
ncbi:MAG: DUF4430 domain-containing protein [Candidatus Wildermuthbacteria bacterium]|nr:DUF4430 domain-containing protein [Candidatus Wildermuthbacteria bacterium]